jgi:hypothetical protein
VDAGSERIEQTCTVARATHHLRDVRAAVGQVA